MARSIIPTHSQRLSITDRYLAETISYGGEMVARGKVMLDLKRCGLDERAIDRYLQGAELRQRLEAERTSKDG